MNILRTAIPSFPPASRVGIIAAAGAAMLAFATPDAAACTGCNITFQREMLAERSDTLAGRDIALAMANQQTLPILGFSEGPFGSPAQEREPVLMAQAAPASTEAAPTQEPAFATAPARQMASMFAGADFIEVIERDEGLATRPTSFVSQGTTPDRSFTIELDEGLAYMGNGVMYNGFLTNGKIPGPTLIMEEGEIIEFRVINKGTVPHGASIHAAYTQTSKYMGAISPGQEKTFVFRATHPGVFMYHCAPGGHAIPMHVLGGQYGMMVVRPKDTKYKLEEELGRPPDVEINLVQHEWYANGKDAVEGNPMYVTFNGKLFRYIEDPIPARPGDYVRINFLNVGPNLLSTFHIVGILWDYAYWQGHPENVLVGGQSVTAGPSDSFVIEFRMPPEEGAFTMLSHVVGSTSRGAIGLIVSDKDAETPVQILADGPKHTQEELTEMAAKAVRTIAPFDIGSPDVDGPVLYGSHTKEVKVQIIGNSFYPKVIQIEPGTTVTWTNEDVFAYLAGEFSGIHNAVMTSGPDRFASPLLAHAESYSFTFTQEGEYEYICTPHPYMRGKVIVQSSSEPAIPQRTARTTPFWLVALVFLSLGVGAAGLFRRKG